MNEITKCGVARCSESLEYALQNHTIVNTGGFSYSHCGNAPLRKDINDILFWESIND